MKYIIKLLKPLDWCWIVLAIGFIIFGVWLDIEMPTYMGKITTLLNEKAVTGETNDIMGPIWENGGLMIAFTVASVIVSLIVAVIVAKIVATIVARLRAQVFYKVQSFSKESISKFSISSLVTRTTNDIEQIMTLFIFGLQSIVKSPILVIWALAKISASGEWQWSASIGIAVGVLLFIVLSFVAVVLPKFKIIQSQTDDLNKVSRERLSGIRVIRAYNAEKYQGLKFENVNNNLTKTNLFTSRRMAILFPCMNAIFNGLFLAIYWIAAFLIADLKIDPANIESVITQRLVIFSDMMVFSQYAMQILMGIMMIVMIFLFLPRAMVSIKRINEVLNTKTKIIEGNLTMKDCLSRGEINFKNVNFKYPDAEDYVLENINFSVKPGETIAFIGSTGSGKSTIANLIPRFYDVTDGEIIINGHNIKDYKQSELNDLIGYVSQKPKLFSGTIRSNVAFGEKQGTKINEKLVMEGLEIAQAKDFVEKTEKQINSFVAQDGVNYSGGQKQRLSIARAIARKPDFLIFDDSFSALDYRTDKVLRKAIKDNVKESTIIIIAQRIGTIMNADKIVVLDDGKIVGIGTHDQLLKNNPVYQEIAYSQLSKEELANG